MKLRLILVTREWQVCWPQAGSASGYSAWETMPRNEALNHLERGVTYDTFLRKPDDALHTKAPH